MAAATITSVAVLNNPAPFADPIALEVTYECLTPLKDDLEWRVVYVGSAESEQHDQVLDSAFVGPVTPGTYKFRMEAPAPDPSRIPKGDLVGVTALLLTCSYRGREFVRVGYYVSTEYPDPEMQESPPEAPVVAKLVRSVLADHPRVTKFPIPFDDDDEGAAAGEAAGGGQAAGMAGGMGGGGGGAGAAGGGYDDANQQQYEQQQQPPGGGAGGGGGGGAAFGGFGGGAAGGGGAAFGGFGGGGGATGGGQQENMAPVGGGATPGGGMDVDGAGGGGAAAAALKTAGGVGAPPPAIAGMGGAGMFGGF